MQWKELDTKISFRSSMKSNSVQERIEEEHGNGGYFFPVDGDNNHRKSGNTQRYLPDSWGLRQNAEYYSDGDGKEDSWYLKAVIGNKKSKDDHRDFGRKLEAVSETGSTILRGLDTNGVSFASSMPLLSPVSSMVREDEDVHIGGKDAVNGEIRRSVDGVSSAVLPVAGEHALVPDVDQLKVEEDVLYQNKMNIVGDIESCKKKLNELTDQKAKSEQELSTLMYELQHARIALENLQCDFENEKQELERRRDEIMSDLNANLELKKNDFLFEQKEAEKDLEERCRRNEALCKDLEEKEFLYEQRIKEIEVQSTQLRVDVKSFNEHYDRIMGRLQEREQQLSAREEEFRDKLSKANELIEKESDLKKKETLVNTMESDLHKRIIDWEEKSVNTEKAKRLLEEELETLQADRKEFENSKQAEIEDLKKEKASLRAWESTLQETSREIQIEKEQLQSLRLEEKEIKVEITLLEEKFKTLKKELESVENTRALEEQKMTVFAEQRKDLEKMESDISRREESLSEASCQLERDKLIYDSKFLEVRALEEVHVLFLEQFCIYCIPSHPIINSNCSYWLSDAGIDRKKAGN